MLRQVSERIGQVLTDPDEHNIAYFKKNGIMSLFLDPHLSLILDFQKSILLNLLNKPPTKDYSSNLETSVHHIGFAIFS